MERESRERERETTRVSYRVDVKFVIEGNDCVAGEIKGKAEIGERDSLILSN